MKVKVHTEYIFFKTKKKKELVHITERIRDIVKNSGVKEGFCLVSAMHITSGIIVNDYEEGLMEDIMEWLEKLAPYKENYKHHRGGEANGDAHLKRILSHHQTIIPITNGNLDLGPWEQVFYAEYDGQRRKRIIIKVMGI